MLRTKSSEILRLPSGIAIRVVARGPYDCLAYGLPLYNPLPQPPRPITVPPARTSEIARQIARQIDQAIVGLTLCVVDDRDEDTPYFFGLTGQPFTVESGRLIVADQIAKLDVGCLPIGDKQYFTDWLTGATSVDGARLAELALGDAGNWARAMARDGVPLPALLPIDDPMRAAVVYSTIVAAGWRAEAAKGEDL